MDLNPAFQAEANKTRSMLTGHLCDGAGRRSGILRLEIQPGVKVRSPPNPRDVVEWIYL